MAEKEQRVHAPEAEREAESGAEGREDRAAKQAEDGGGDRIRELEEALEAAKAKAEENWNQFVRARADLENVRRRTERDLEHAHKYGLEKIAAELLPVKDSLEMGIAAAQDANADVAKLTEGTELTLKMLQQVMERFHVQELNPLGQKFDPSRHEAMAAQESAEHEPNTVIHVVQKGYLLNDRLIRPAMVIVSKASDQPGGSGQIDEQA